MKPPAMLTRAELSHQLTDTLDITLHDAELLVEAIVAAMIRALQSGDEIEIRGFGSFRIRERRARIARNPKTGTRVSVPLKKIVFFRPARELREFLKS